MYYPFVRKTLSRLDPEHAHEFTFQQLRRITEAPFETLVRQKVPAKPVDYIDLASKGPLGLAAGLDKGGECIDALSAMGFGSIETGTITPRSRPGNDKPRLFRLVDVEGLINHMGFNNLGIDNLVENIKKAHYDGVLDTNIGKNRDTPVEQGRDNYLVCMEKIYTYTGYIVTNISPPNTPGLRTLQYGEALDNLLTAIKNKRNDLQVMRHRYIPTAMKIAPDLSEEELIQVANSLARHNIDGVIATNTTLDRSLIQGMKDYDQTGGLSGRPLRLKNIEIIRRLSQELNGRLSIISADDIDSVIIARERIAAGTSLIQIYSGSIFRGPSLIEEIITHI